MPGLENARLDGFSVHSARKLVCLMQAETLSAPTPLRIGQTVGVKGFDQCFFLPAGPAGISIGTHLALGSFFLLSEQPQPPSQFGVKWMPAWLPATSFSASAVGRVEKSCGIRPSLYHFART